MVRQKSRLDHNHHNHHGFLFKLRCFCPDATRVFCWNPSMEIVSGQRATLRRREGARGRRERRLRAEARIRLQLCRDAVRIASHRGGEGYKAGREARVVLHGHVPEAPLPQGRVLRHVVGIFPCLLLMFLCRRWWTSCRTLSNSFVHSHLILSRLSKCPRSCLSMSLCARPCALRSWWNSWWKCRRSFPIPRYCGLWSSTSTFQFLVVEDQLLVLKVFPLDRVQLLRLPPRNAFLSGFWSRSLLRCSGFQ